MLGVSIELSSVLHVFGWNSETCEASLPFSQEAALETCKSIESDIHWYSWTDNTRISKYF